MDFINPRELPFTPIQSRGELPHLYKNLGTYFITTRLLDAVIPRTLRTDITNPESTPDPDPESLMLNYDPPITLGSCPFNRPDVASMVQDALLFHNQTRYELRAWCLMPNHVHIVLQTRDGHALDHILRDWKGFTSRAANKLLSRQGPFWERESFDHLIRTPDSLQKFINYTIQNPVKAGLSPTPQQWRWSSVFAGEPSKPES